MQRIGYRRQFWLEMFCSVLVLIFLGIIIKEGISLTLLNRERTFGDSTLSYAWVTAAVPAGCLLLAVSLAYNMVTAFQKRGEGLLVYTRTGSEKEIPSQDF